MYNIQYNTTSHTQQKLVSRWGVGKHVTMNYIYAFKIKKCITWNQCYPVAGVEGEKASFFLKSESDCAVFAS